MNISFANTIDYLTNIDVKRSPCGRDLGLKGQIANLAIKSSTLAKVVFVAGLIGLAMVCFIPWNLGSLVNKMIVKSSLSIADKAVSHLFVKFGEIIAVYFGINWLGGFLAEYLVQQQEKQVVQALGGQGAYHALPIMVVVEEDDLLGLDPDDVHQQPITAGFVKKDRVFIALHIQAKQQQGHFARVNKLRIITLYQKAENPVRPNAWHVVGKEKIALGQGNFDEKIDNLQKLVLGTHPTHELV